MKAEPTVDDLRLSMTFPAQVLRNVRVPALQTIQAQVSVDIMGDREALLNVLRTAHVLDDAILTEHPPYFWPARISNSMLDSYDTRMDPSTTLVNFVQDAIDGVSFCDTHNHNELAFGRSFAAVLDTAPALSEAEQVLLNDVTEQKSVIAGLYTLPGLKTNRVTTDDLILAMRGGLAKDVSVGFKTGPGFMYRCSICGLDLFDWDCEHIPGVVYEVTESDAADAATISRYAFAWIVNARLSEISAAYDGATPECMIIKATREAESGRIPQRLITLVEQRCRIHLPGKRVSAPGFSEKERTHVTDEEKLKEAARKALEELLGVGRSSLVRLGLVQSGQESTITSVADVVSRLDAEVARLQPLAAEGVALRKELVDSAIAEGARAMSKDFNEESQRKTLMSLDIESVKNMRSNWQTVGDNLLGKGKGRKTSDDVDETDKGKTRAAGAGAADDDADTNDRFDFDEDSVIGV